MSTYASDTSGAEFAMDNETLANRSTMYRADLLAGRRIVISGGGSGIGKATAFLCSRLGADVAICGRKAEKLEATVAAIAKATGRTVFASALSIRDPDAVETFIGEVHAHFGGLDVLINNAGGHFPSAATDISRKGWLAVVDTNLNGTWWMMQEAAKVWRDTGAPGTIVNVVFPVDRGVPQLAHACAARAGVIYLSKTLALEWAPLKIKVNCLALGATLTEGFRVYPDLTNFKTNPMKDSADPFEVAETLVYQASPAAKFMTGAITTLDGGQSQFGLAWPLGCPDYFNTGGG